MHFASSSYIHDKCFAQFKMITLTGHVSSGAAKQKRKACTLMFSRFELSDHENLYVTRTWVHQLHVSGEESKHTW